MKYIKISDEEYEFLNELQNNLKTQDNRCTIKPFFYTIQEDKEIVVPDGYGDEVWILDGEVCLRTEDDIKKIIFECNDWDLKNKKDNLFYEELSCDEIEEILNDNNYYKVNVDIINTYSNCFLTEKACEKYIKYNKHNLINPKSYVDHAFRNPEMEKLITFIENLKIMDENKLEKNPCVNAEDK